MDDLLVMQGAKRMARIVSTTFLLVHVVLILLFSACGVTPMVYFNIGSIAFYLFSFVIIGMEMLWLFVDLVYAEVVAHMTCAATLTGWENDFQFSIIGMCTLAFFAEYLCRSLEIRRVKALPLCLVGVAIYLSACAFCEMHPAPYPLPAGLSFFMRLAWGIIVFFISLVILQTFMTRAFRAERMLESRLSHDKLTGLPNRYFVSEYLSKLGRFRDLDSHWVAVSDIDDFKKVNDTYGHNAGDLVLETVAAIMRKAATEDMQVCRWGGEEFLLVGSLEGGKEAVVKRLERMRQAVADQVVWYEEQLISVTVTIGMAAYEPGQTTEEWINAADERLYLGKTTGKNKVVS